MRCAIEITEESQLVLSSINSGVIPQVEKEQTFFIIGDDDTPNEIVNRDELVKKLGTNYEAIMLDVFVWPN